MTQGLFPPAPEAVVAYAGHWPIVLIRGEYYAVIGKCSSGPQELWHCFRMKLHPEFCDWYCADDEDYYFDRLGEPR